MKKNIVFVFILSLVLSLFNSIGFFAAYIQKPIGTVYLGTIHYWEDYFLYLNHFFQGAHGGWLTINRFTTETTNPSIIYWSNVLLGKLSSLIHLSPVMGYNASVIILSFFALVSSYILLRTRIFPLQPKRAFLAFFFASLATSLINYVKSSDGSMILWPFQIWRTPHFAFDRLGGAPHQLMQTLLFYGTVFFLFAPKNMSRQKELITILFTAGSGVLLASVNPIQAAFLFAGATVLVIANFFINHNVSAPIPLLRLLITSAITAIAVLVVSQILNLPPHIQSKAWEAAQQGSTSIDFLLLSIGPILVFLAIVGFVTSRKTLSPIEWFGLCAIVFGYILFLSPIPKHIGISNMRILFPSSYVFWGAFAARGLSALGQKLSMPIILILFLLTTVPTLLWELSQKMPKATDAANPLVYLPQDAFAAFSSLSLILPFDDIVLANPSTHMDALVPPLSGHTTFSGHMLATMNNEEKQMRSRQFFTGQLAQEAAQSFLTNNKIRYIITTTKSETTTIGQRYPFLGPYKTFGESAAIFAL